MDYERLYEYRHRQVAQDSRQKVWNEIARYVFERMGRPARVLDPAAGRGEFINAIPAEERWIVDRFPPDAANLDSRVKVLRADVLEAELPVSYFDGVFVSNFLEHLETPKSVAQFLAKMFSTLRPGGTIAVMGPNFRYCMKDYFDCADHMLALTDVSVAEHLHAAGFDVVSSVSRFIPFSFRGSLPSSASLTRLYLGVPLAWKVLGKQFLVIGTRPRLAGQA